MSRTYTQEEFDIDRPYWYVRYISPEIRNKIENELIVKGIPFDKFIEKVIKQMKVGDNLNDLNDKILNNFR